MTDALSAKTYCNVLAIQRGLDPAGSAGNFEDSVIVEIPLPWKKGIYQDAKVLSPQMIDLYELWLKRYREGLGYPHRPLMVAPDPRYSVPGFRRVMFFSRPKTAFAQYDKREYLVPDDQFGALLWALYEAPDDLPRFEPYRDPANDTTRDLLVCTHGTVDAACAKFGYPLYHYLHKHHARDHHLRVWRVSHFGGHVYAPTLLDMPLGHYWAYVEAPQADQIVARDGAVEALRGHYRGWAGLEYGMMQAAEREMWQREGWAWFGYPKTGAFLAKDESGGDEPKWAEMRVEFTDGAGAAWAYEARMEVCAPVTTEYATGSPETHPHVQYAVTRIDKFPA